jgi:hypothetical protein
MQFSAMMSEENILIALFSPSVPSLDELSPETEYNIIPIISIPFRDERFRNHHSAKPTPLYTI